MHDLPTQAALQQAKARPISGEELEVMGKQAASCFLSGAHPTLTEAVVETVKRAGLSPEQVLRVVEFTNQNAYRQEFQKEGSTHKFIDFPGGPASPSEVLQDLNDGGGGTVFDRGSSDYSKEPKFSKTAAALTSMEKTASAETDPLEAAFEAMFKVAKGESLPFVEPMQDTIVAREKLASARDALTSDLSFLETEFHGVLEDLYEQVKQAAMAGVPLGHVVQAWASLDPAAGLVKAAFSHIGPRLNEQGVMPLEEIGASLRKTASAVVNERHPLVQTFAAFADRLEKLAHTRAALVEVNEAFSRISHFEKRASSALAGTAGAIGLVPKAWRGATQLARSAAPHVEAKATEIGGALLGPQAGGALGKAVGSAVQYAPHAAAAIGAKELYDRGFKYGPGQIPVRFVKSHIPGTRENYAREIGLQQGMWPM
jgi:hypothetical protein